MTSEPNIRPIIPADNAAIAAIIREVLASFGLTGNDSAFGDSEVSRMFEAYQEAGSRYFVVEFGGNVVGGAGYGRLAGSDGSVCEIRKMYLRSEVRGKGLGRNLLTHVLAEAKTAGYVTCYLETIPSMTVARALYESLGFRLLDAPMGNTGHTACHIWYAKPL